MTMPITDHLLIEYLCNQCDDADLVCTEILHGANFIKHGAKWLLLVQGEDDYTAQELLTELDKLLDQQRTNWLARNRRGGLEDSMRRFDKLRGEYLRMIDEG